MNKDPDAELKKRLFDYRLTVYIIKRALTYNGMDLDPALYEKLEQMAAEKYGFPENSIFRIRYKDLSKEDKTPQP